MVTMMRRRMLDLREVFMNRWQAYNAWDELSNVEYDALRTSLELYLGRGCVFVRPKA